MKGNYSLARNDFIEKWDKEKYRDHNKLGNNREGRRDVEWKEERAQSLTFKEYHAGCRGRRDLILNQNYALSKNVLRIFPQDSFF